MSQTAAIRPIDGLVDNHEFRMLIGGEMVGATSGATFASVDPSTGQEIARVPDGGAEDIGRAVAAAQRAFPAWAALGVVGRSDIFARLAEAVRANSERLAMLDAVDGGMPYKAMLFDIEISLQNIRDWPSLVRWHGGRTVPATQGNLHYTSYQPYGVVGKIIPFNHPVMFAITRILPALIAGNTVVLKAAQQTPLSALVFGEITRDVLPPGVVNVVSGGAEPGDALVRNASVKRISFTGSVSTGMRVQERAAGSGIKAISLELGGKNPMIVFPDVDLEDAVAGAISGMNFGVCSGQSCGSNSRVYVHRDLYEGFLSRAAEDLSAMKVGRGYDETTQMGPLVSRQHYDRVMRFVQSGRDEGARLVTGGSHPGGDIPRDGYYLQPTVFGDVAPTMDIARSEIFGPVLSVAPWTDYDDVVEQANDSELGLTASVWTNDLSLAHKTAAKLEAGYVWINDSAKHFFGMPFGGMKSSGLGREESVEEYESYLELKAVHTILKEPAEAIKRLYRA